MGNIKAKCKYSQILHTTWVLAFLLALHQINYSKITKTALRMKINWQPTSYTCLIGICCIHDKPTIFNLNASYINLVVFKYTKVLVLENWIWARPFFEVDCKNRCRIWCSGTQFDSAVFIYTVEKLVCLSSCRSLFSKYIFLQIKIKLFRIS